MRKLLCFLLAVAAMFSLVGCSVSEADIYSDVLSFAEENFGSYDFGSYEDEYEYEYEYATYDESSSEGLTDEALPAAEATSSSPTAQTVEAVIDENGSYTSRDDVALYIHTYGKLPQNFITKKEAQALGWSGGSLEPYAPGKCIGGTYFGNYEGILPEKEGRSYTECDIDTLGKDSRGAKRIVFSNDGLIYYTEDHYSTFTLLYGEE